MLQKSFLKRILSTLVVSITILAFLVGCGQQRRSDDDSQDQFQEEMPAEPESEYGVEPEDSIKEELDEDEMDDEQEDEPLQEEPEEF